MERVKTLISHLLSPVHQKRTMAAKLIRTLMNKNEVSVLSLISENIVPPLLHMAQIPDRTTPDLQPVPDTPTEISESADAALLLLGEMASFATDLLASEGWEIIDDDGWPRYVNETLQQKTRDPPTLEYFGTLEEVDEWTFTLVLELPCIVAPFVSVNKSVEKGQVLVWPVRVLYHTKTGDGMAVSVMDLTEEADEDSGTNEGETLSRVLVLGTWKGMLSYRESEIDLAYPQGTHLENWYSVTMAGLAILNPSESQRILQIGLGGGTITSFLSRHIKNPTITCIELESAVGKVAEQYFGVTATNSLLHPNEKPHHPAVFEPLPTPCNIIIAEAQSWVSGAVQREEKWDTVLLDVHTQDAFPRTLLTSEFFRDLSRVVSKQMGSMLVINAGSGSEWGELKKHAEAEFAYVQLVVDGREAAESESFVILASHQPVTVSVPQWKSRSQGLLQQTPFTLEGVAQGESLVVTWGGNYSVAPEERERMRTDGVALGDPIWQLFD
ncbi:hypothetical protein HK098_006370 [Nowakowskiella sp. JEL0407]|nr:hypothetical protein HK098_006370 [Nowakowskiella sp. JEL0407]